MAAQVNLLPAVALSAEGLQKEAEVIRTQIDQSMIAVSTEIVKALAAGLQAKSSFKELADKHITEYTALPAEDEKARCVFSKLSAEFHIFCTTRKDVVATSSIKLTLMMVAQQDSEAKAAQFLGTFIGNETRALVKRLDELKNPKLYEADLWK